MATIRELVNLIGFKVDETQLNKANQKIKNFQKGLLNTGKVIGVGLLAIGGMALKTAGDMEMLTTQFEVMLGSTEKAEKMMKLLTKEAASTPFALKDLAQGTQTLLSFGVAEEDVIKTMRMLGDTAGGNREKLNGLILAYGKVQTKGKASMEEINMMAERGLPIINVLTKNLGVTEEQFFKLVSAGKVSKDEIKKAFQTMTSEGGMFFKGMEKQSLTFFGMLSTLKDNLFLLLGEIGATLLPAFKDLVSMAIDLLQGDLGTALKKILEVLPPIINLISNTFKQLLPVLMPIIDIIVDIVKELFVLFDPLISIIKSLLVILAPVFKLLKLLSPIIAILKTVLDIIAEILNAIAPSLASILDSLLSIIVEITSEFLYLFNDILKELSPVLSPFLASLASILKLLAPIIKLFSKWFIFSTKLQLNFLLTPLRILAKIMGVTNRIMASIINLISNIVTPVIERLSGLFQGIIDFIQSGIDAVIEQMEKVFSWIDTQISKITGFIENLPFFDKKKKTPEETAEQVVKETLQKIDNSTIKNQNITVQNDFAINGAKDPAQTKDMVSRGADAIFNIQLKKILVESGL